MTGVYICTLAVCAFFCLIGHYRSKSYDFYKGSGDYDAIISAASLVAAFTGGSALVNTTGLASAYGSWAFFDVLPTVLGLFLAAVLVAIGFFGKRFSTAFFDVTSNNYDKRAVRVHYAQVCFLYTLVIAAQFRAVATVAKDIQVAPWLAVLVCGFTVGAYAFRGFNAVTRTDVAQLLLMSPMYVMLAYVAGEPTQTAAPAAQTNMPWALAASLCLPAIFLPISQELHQRGAAAKSDTTLWQSYILAGCVFFALASTLVLTFSAAPGLTLSNVINGGNAVGSCILVVGITSAILSTLDTATNIASHAAQKLSPLERLPSWSVQVVLLAIGAGLYLIFPTVLTLILFALFVYIAGPAFTFVAVYLGVHPRSAATIGVIFSTLQTTVQLKVVTAPSFSTVRNLLPTQDPIHLGLALLVIQAAVVAGTLAIRRFR
jgi:hypothetical protein